VFVGLAYITLQSGNRLRADVVAAANVGKRLAFVTALDRLPLRVIGKFERSAHFLPVRLDGHSDLREPHRAASTQPYYAVAERKASAAKPAIRKRPKFDD
jgi:hypothetical protein